MYLAQEEPLGPHINAIRFILNSRGDSQLYDRSRFALFRAANCRLQARQLLRGEDPEPLQEELLSKLNVTHPDIHIAVDIMRMSHLCAEARKLLQWGNDRAAGTLTAAASTATRLLKSMRDLIAAVSCWTSSMTGVWQPKVIDAHSITRPEEAPYSSDHPLANFECPSLFSYSDIWFAYIWNFHAASQIVLREALIQIVHYRARLQHEYDSQHPNGIIDEQRGAIENLSASIIKSFPPLMGFTDVSGKLPPSIPQGLMAGRSLALFAMDVVRKAEFTPPEHKNTAFKVANWIHASHALN